MLKINKQFQKAKEHFPQAIVNIDGELFSPETAKVSFFDRGLLYGDSIYEVFLARGTQTLFYEEHINRLKRSASTLFFELSPQFLTRIQNGVEQVLENLALDDDSLIHIRLVITRGVGDMHLGSIESCSPSFHIMGRPLPDISSSFFEEGVRICLANVLRNSPNALEPNCKSGNYLNNVFASHFAKKQNCFDSVMLSQEGHLAEGSVHNIWFIKDGMLKTPDKACGLLEGITRLKLMEFCDENALPYEVGFYDPEDLYTADQVFFTSTTKGILPVCQYEDKKYSVGDSTYCGKIRVDFWNWILTQFRKK